jgi:hypothetical protein
MEELFFMWSVPRGYKRDKLSSVRGVCEERTWAREAEESPLLEAVVRVRLVKPQQGEGLAFSDLWNVEISNGIIVICSYDL